MNRTDYMRAVYATDLDPASKAILVYYGFCKNWKDNTLAFPSAARVSVDTGYSVETVKRRIPALRQAGYLTDTGQRRGRGVIVYDLADPSSVTQTPLTDSSTSVTETPQDEPVSERHLRSVTQTPQECQGDTAAVSHRHTEQVLNKLEELEQEQVPESPVPDGPVDEIDSSLNFKEDDAPLVNSEEHEDSKSETEAVNHWVFLHREEKAFFERADATEEQKNEAVKIYRTGGLHHGGWYANAEAALKKVGVEFDEW